LFFGKNDRVLVTPGLYEFDARAGRSGGADKGGAPHQPYLPHPPHLPS